MFYNAIFYLLYDVRTLVLCEVRGGSFKTVTPLYESDIDNFDRLVNLYHNADDGYLTKYKFLQHMKEIAEIASPFETGILRIYHHGIFPIRQLGNQCLYACVECGCFRHTVGQKACTHIIIARFP